MMSSLPTCTILFNRNCELIDMNQLASDFLLIENKTDFIKKGLRLNTDYFYLNSVIDELKTGKTISKEKMKFKRADDSVVCVEFNACMLYGPNKLFIFQFFETLPIQRVDYQFIINSTYHDIQKLQSKITELGNSMLTELNVVPARSVDHDGSPFSLSKIYTNLTQNEVAICELIGNGLTVKEVSENLNKTQNNVYVTIKRITYKLNLRSIGELRRQLKGFAA